MGTDWVDERMHILYDFFDAHNIANIKSKPEGLFFPVDSVWSFACHNDPSGMKVMGCPTSEGMAVDTPRCHFTVWYRGYFCGCLGPTGGGPFATGNASLDNFFAALIKHIERDTDVTGLASAQPDAP